MSDGEKRHDEYGEPPIRDSWADGGAKRHLGVLRRHIWIALSVFVIVATLGCLRAYRAAPIYQSSARIMIEREGPHYTKFQEAAQSQVPLWGSDYYKTQEQLIRSRAILEVALENAEIRKMFDQTGQEAGRKRSLMASLRQSVSALLAIPASAPSEPWERLRGMVVPKHIVNTHFLTVSVEGSHPSRAAQIANAVADAFIRYHVRRKLEISNDVFLYLEEQKGKEERALRESEMRLQEFREQTAISSLDATDKDHPTLRRLSVLNEELTGAQLSRINLESEHLIVKQALDSGADALQSKNERLFSVPSVRNDPGVAQIRGQLVVAEEAFSAMAEIYGAEHPNYQAAEARIVSLRERLAGALDEIVRSSQMQLAVLSQKELALRGEYAQQQGEALDLAKQALTFENLKNEIERHRRLFDVLVQRMSEVALTSDYTRTNVELIEQASPGKTPIKPNKRRMAMLSLLMGLAAGIGLAFFVEYLDDTVRTPEDLERRVGVPVLGFVPDIRVRKDVESRTAYRALVTALEPESSAIEAYRNIRTALFFSIPAEEAKVMIVSSSGPGDGKTTTATNLALVIAQSGKRVLLIDADFRRPMVHKVFGLDPSVGLSSVLVGESSLSDAVQKTVHDLELLDNLDILAAGPKPLNPTELLESAAMTKLLDEARAKYDRIILDTAPVLFVSDTSVLCAVSDGVIMVVRSAKRRGVHAARARKQIEKVKGRIIGGILNRVQVSRLGHYYSDYYYYGYARYHRDYYKSYYARDEEEASIQEKTAGV